LTGIKAKIFNKTRFKEKVAMKKAIKAHEQKNVEIKVDKKEGAMPAYLLDRENINRSKVHNLKRY
jgi:ribosome biogenesis protein NSA2